MALIPASGIERCSRSTAFKTTRQAIDRKSARHIMRRRSLHAHYLLTLLLVINMERVLAINFLADDQRVWDESVLCTGHQDLADIHMDGKLRLHLWVFGVRRQAKRNVDLRLESLNMTTPRGTSCTKMATPTASSNALTIRLETHMVYEWMSTRKPIETKQCEKDLLICDLSQDSMTQHYPHCNAIQIRTVWPTLMLRIFRVVLQ